VEKRRAVSRPVRDRRRISGLVLGWLLAVVLAAPPTAVGASRPLADGVVDHGVATPLSQSRGMVATADAAGRDVMLVWLYDHRGGYALLMIDALTGKAEQFATPYPWGSDGPFASLLSREQKYYTHFGGHFSEFDPARRAFTFFGKSAPQMAMSLTEADDGTIWAATYPKSGLVYYRPGTREFRDYGAVNQENWLQYPRSVATDDAGWVYVGIGSAQAQMVALDPRTAEFKPLLAPAARRQGYATVERDLNGKVYGHVATDPQSGWYELHGGVARPIAPPVQRQRKPYIASSQSLFHAQFPSGRRAKSCDTVSRTLVVEDPKAGTTHTVHFDYTSEGAHLIAVAAAPGGTLSGGTAFPMRMFRFAPETDTWTNWPAVGQFNTVARQGDRFFVGGYPHGFLLEWEPAAAFAASEKAGAGGNPRFLTECEPTINRPHDLLALPDGRTVILAGTPGYGFTGGGLLFWDRATQSRTLLEHTDLLPQQSTMSLVGLPGGKVLGGTTTGAGTGGEKKAREAELYVLDVATKTLEWHAAVFPGTQTYTDLGEGPRGLIYGYADSARFFVFDPQRRTVVHSAETRSKYGPIVTGQGPRAFVRDGERVYVLFTRGIARLDPETFALTWLANAPSPITAGGDVLAGRLYFAAGSHLFSYALPK
jgi:hypothetical protein